MQANDFLKECFEAGCIIVPIELYSHYNNEEDTSYKDSEGIKYIAIETEPDAVGPDYWWMIDISISGRDNYYDTPEEALNAFKNRE